MTERRSPKDPITCDQVVRFRADFLNRLQFSMVASNKPLSADRERALTRLQFGLAI
jgi:hypothetical protein